MGMKYVGAYLLDALSGNSPTADSIKAILEAGGMEVDMAMVKLVMSKMEGKDIAEVMSAGKSDFNLII
jgi:large subunit ribosomal protein LP2